MAWLEMSRNSTHGDLTGKSDWSFKKCLWSPIRKRDGGRNAYWETMSMIEKGDVIIHMRWINGDPFLVGTSIAASDCFIETNERPPDPEEWAYATSFYRVLLEDFEDFPVQLSLRKIFDNSDQRFRKYLSGYNSRTKGSKVPIFFTVRSNPNASSTTKLQPNQGAYLTYLDEQLFDLLIPIVDPTRMSTLSPLFSSQPQKQVQTSESIRNVRIREGQNRFSLNVRKNYNFQCCFPDCNIKEARFLTGSHIARWADHPELRGNASNGLCLCLMHDKAFEIGYFTINIQNQVVLNKKNQAARKSDWYKQALQPFDRQFITIPLGAIPPSTEALAQHWARIDFIP